MKKKERFFSLQYKILLFSFTIVLVSAVSVGLVSYHKSSQIMKKKVSQSNLNTVKQVGKNVEFIMNDVNNVSLNIIQHPKVRRFLKMTYARHPNQREKVSVEQAITDQFGTKAFIDSVFLKSFSGIVLDTSGALNPVSPSVKEKVIRREGGKTWAVDQAKDYDGTQKHVLSLVRMVKDINQLDQNLAVLKINIAEQDISELFRENTLHENNAFMLIDQDHRILSSLNKKKIGRTLTKAWIPENGFADEKGIYESTVKGHPYVMAYYKLQHSPFFLMMTVPLSEVLQDHLVIRNVTITVIILTFLLCAFLSVVFAANVLGPLQKLRSLMGDLEKGNFDVRFRVTSRDEVAMLGHRFNKMSERLKELIQKVYTMRIKQKEAELKALQAQIHPHFLYNTLDTIYWMSRMENAPQSSQLVQALSKLFRSSLSGGDEMTTVQEEVRHLKHYMTIQKARYEDSIHFSVQVDDHVQQCRTVRLTLQPLVENAIFHGIEPTGRKGKVDVWIRREKDDLIFDVIDNGRGIDLEKVYRLMRSEEQRGRFGIKNVHERIQLYFGESYGLTFEHNENTGTKVRVRQPVQHG